MRLQILVRLKPGVLDVQGKAVEAALTNVGINSAANVRIGRLVELDIEAEDFDSAKTVIKEKEEVIDVASTLHASNFSPQFWISFRFFLCHGNYSNYILRQINRK